MQLLCRRSDDAYGDPVRGGLEALIKATERELVDRLSLSPRPVPEEFVLLRGAIGARSTELVTRVFAGGPIARLCVAVMTVEGVVASCTVHALPRADVAASILGLDYVGIAGALSLVALDLSPTIAGVTDTCQATLVELGRAAARHLTMRPRPEFVADVFSPHAVLARAGRDEAALACALGVDLLAAYGRWCANAGPRAAAEASEAASRIEGWRAAMLRNKREAAALQRIFGALAGRYLEDFLFAPDPASDTVFA